MPCPGPFRLADGIGLAAFGGSVIVLDIMQDRYSRFGGRAAEALLAVRNGNNAAIDGSVIEALATRGLVTRALPRPSPWLDVADIVPPEKSVLEGPDQADPGELIQFAMALACVKARIDLRRQPLHVLLGALPGRARGRPFGMLVSLARMFDHARRLAPVRPRCLPDTLAFVRLARRRGHAVDLIFGVKLFPFEAHCWAQSGGLVLTDPLDRIRRFSPILAL
jgi:hypothetical protein